MAKELKKSTEELKKEEGEAVTENIPGNEPLTEVYQDLYQEDDVVPETGHYVCVYCNQIESFAEGELFTTCPAGHGEKQVCWKNID